LNLPAERFPRRCSEEIYSIRQTRHTESNTQAQFGASPLSWQQPHWHIVRDVDPGQDALENPESRAGRLEAQSNYILNKQPIGAFASHLLWSFQKEIETMHRTPNRIELAQASRRGSLSGCCIKEMLHITWI
jgi:hypothetical protein